MHRWEDSQNRGFPPIAGIFRYWLNGGFCVWRARVWGPGADVEEASLDSYVHFIRRRLRAVSSRVTVDTVRGVGYRLLDGGTGA